MTLRLQDTCAFWKHLGSATMCGECWMCKMVAPSDDVRCSALSMEGNRCVLIRNHPDIPGSHRYQPRVEPRPEEMATYDLLHALWTAHASGNYNHDMKELWMEMGGRLREIHDAQDKAARKAAETMPGGAVRDPQTADFSQLSYIGIRKIAETCHEGDLKYGRDNWRKGMPVSNLLSHAMEHIFQLQSGDVSENHLGHALWNLMIAAEFIETRPELIDILPLRKAMGLGE